MTLEEATAKVVELEGTVKTLTEEKTTLSATVKERDERITSLQEHNQKLYLKLTNTGTKPDGQKDETVKTLNELAALI